MQCKSYRDTKSDSIGSNKENSTSDTESANWNWGTTLIQFSHDLYFYPRVVAATPFLHQVIGHIPGQEFDHMK